MARLDSQAILAGFAAMRDGTSGYGFESDDFESDYFGSRGSGAEDGDTASQLADEDRLAATQPDALDNDDSDSSSEGSIGNVSTIAPSVEYGGLDFNIDRSTVLDWVCDDSLDE
nr:uncharacterized protein CTRU02_07414 [Colletotrichum truncatum]KAF6791074.1 hypothetical protein CTRU02_07414 [Colletotrichum truncatum]